MGHKPDKAVCIYGAGLLLKHLQALNTEIDGVRRAEDIECIHRMRVASRRLRSALSLFDACLPASKKDAWIKEVQKITRALGAARDLDVQIDLLETFYKNLSDPKCRPGIRRLILRLTQKRSKLQARVMQSLDELDASQFIPKLVSRLLPYDEQRETVYLYSPALYTLSFNANSTLLDHLLTFDAVVGKPEEVEALHAMRITAKKVRYTLEAFAPLYENELKEPVGTMRKIQDTLGDIHDCDVWATFLPGFIEKETQRTQAYYGHTRLMKQLIPGLLLFQQDRLQKRAQDFDDFTSYWQTLKDGGSWPALRQLLQAPASPSKLIQDTPPINVS
jgi:CHAD domain-containing protein